MQNLTTRVELLKKIVKEAGEAITELKLQQLVGIKESITDVVTQGDLASEKILVSAINDHFPEDKILSEETEEEAGIRETKEFLWVIDPIDGTYNYGKGRKYSAVCVGISQNKKLLAGAVYNPFTDDFFFAEFGKGAYLNDQHLSVSSVSEIGSAAFVTDTYKTPEGIRRNVNILFQAKDLTKLIVTGSAALGICEVAAARSDVYMHTRLKPWDCAAAFIIASEAGAQITNLRGDEVDFYSREVLVANPQLLKKCVAIFKNNSGS